MDKFAKAEATTPEERAAAVEATAVTSWDELPEGAHEAAQVVAANLDRLVEQTN